MAVCVGVVVGGVVALPAPPLLPFEVQVEAETDRDATEAAALIEGAISAHRRWYAIPPLHVAWLLRREIEEPVRAALPQYERLELNRTSWLTLHARLLPRVPVAYWCVVRGDSQTPDEPSVLRSALPAPICRGLVDARGIWFPLPQQGSQVPEPPLRWVVWVGVSSTLPTTRTPIPPPWFQPAVLSLARWFDAQGVPVRSVEVLPHAYVLRFEEGNSVLFPHYMSLDRVMTAWRRLHEEGLIGKPHSGSSFSYLDLRAWPQVFIGRSHEE